MPSFSCDYSSIFSFLFFSFPSEQTVPWKWGHSGPARWYRCRWSWALNSLDPGSSEPRIKFSGLCWFLICHFSRTEAGMYSLPSPLFSSPAVQCIWLQIHAGASCGHSQARMQFVQEGNEGKGGQRKCSIEGPDSIHIVHCFLMLFIDIK